MSMYSYSAIITKNIMYHWNSLFSSGRVPETNWERCYFNFKKQTLIHKCLQKAEWSLELQGYCFTIKKFSNYILARDLHYS